MKRSAKFLTGTAALLGLSVATIFVPHAFAQGQGVFTQEQANAGHSAYALSCALAANPPRTFTTSSPPRCRPARPEA
jgi:integral membrane sensor domain MASE1